MSEYPRGAGFQEIRRARQRQNEFVDCQISKAVPEAENGYPLKYKIKRLILPILQSLGKAPFVRFLPVKRTDTLIEEAGFRIVDTGNFPANTPNHFVVSVNT